MIFIGMMQRAIKFRIWDNLKNEWVINKSIWRMTTDPYGIGEINPSTFYWKQHPQGLCYQQYTGLTDKNGKDIYEGDILKYSPDYQESQGGQIGADLDPVYFKDGCFWVDDQWLYDQNEVSEIVGNIFESADLMPEKTK